MSKLSLRVELSGASPLRGREISLLAEVWQQGSAATPQHQRVQVPVASGTREIEVASGQVVVQLRLPSGALYSEERTVENGVDQEIVFQPARSPHEWLSWHRFFDRPRAGGGSSNSSPSVAGWEKGSARAEARESRTRSFEALDIGGAVECVEAAEPTAAQSETLGRRLATAGRIELVTDTAGIQFAVDLGPTLLGVTLETEHLTIRGDTDEEALSLTFESRFPGSFDRGVRHLLHLNLQGRSMLSPLPLPWLGSDSTNYHPVPVQLILTSEGDELQPQVVIQDADFGPLLAYFQAGDRAAARTYEDDLARLAKEAMAGDLTNPVPAIAGAYVLLRLGRLDYVRSWLEILADTAPFADGPILVATALLAEARAPGSSQKGGPLERAAGALLKASGRGLPLFAPGISLLRDGLRLTSVRLRSEDPQLSAQLEEALGRACRLSEVVRPGFFFAWLEGETAALADWLPESGALVAVPAEAVKGVFGLPAAEEPVSSAEIGNASARESEAAGS